MKFIPSLLCAVLTLPSLMGQEAPGADTVLVYDANNEEQAYLLVNGLYGVFDFTQISALTPQADLSIFANVLPKEENGEILETLNLADEAIQGVLNIDESLEESKDFFNLFDQFGVRVDKLTYRIYVVLRGLLNIDKSVVEIREAIDIYNRLPVKDIKKLNEDLSDISVFRVFNGMRNSYFLLHERFEYLYPKRYFDDLETRFSEERDWAPLYAIIEPELNGRLMRSLESADSLYVSGVRLLKRELHDPSAKKFTQAYNKYKAVFRSKKASVISRLWAAHGGWLATEPLRVRYAGRSDSIASDIRKYNKEFKEEIPLLVSEIFDHHEENYAEALFYTGMLKITHESLVNELPVGLTTLYGQMRDKKKDSMPRHVKEVISMQEISKSSPSENSNIAGELLKKMTDLSDEEIEEYLDLVQEDYYYRELLQGFGFPITFVKKERDFCSVKYCMNKKVGEVVIQFEIGGKQEDAWGHKVCFEHIVPQKKWLKGFAQNTILAFEWLIYNAYSDFGRDLNFWTDVKYDVFVH
jgi:hypothetical protein